MKSVNGCAERCIAHIEAGSFEWDQERPAVGGCRLVVRVFLGLRVRFRFGCFALSPELQQEPSEEASLPQREPEPEP